MPVRALEPNAQNLPGTSEHNCDVYNIAGRLTLYGTEHKRPWIRYQGRVIG
jgi:hypothetical protein